MLYFCIMLQNNTSDKCLISFIVTFHNMTEELVRECIDSILNLSLRKEEREILVVDDGSDKCLLDSLSDIADNIIYIRKASEGIASARNFGMRIATGKYIQFVDGEDKLLSEAYEHCVDIARYNSPDIVIFNTGSDGSGRNDYEGEEPTEGTEYLKRNNLTTSPWGYLFAERLLAGLKFDTTIEGTEEEFTTLLFLCAEKIYSTSAEAYYDRKCEKRKIDRHDKKAVIRHLDDNEKIIARLQDLSATMPTNDRIALQRRIAQLTMNYILNTLLWTRSSKQLESRITRLESCGLFPLPDKNYSKKYVLFNKLSRRRLIRKMICKMLG
ncbi:MAG TPA: glycosyl transferase family 2 [Prevotella sp.]|nr:glycosyl transferase family 2 [Prevotella sp.]